FPVAVVSSPVAVVGSGLEEDGAVGCPRRVVVGVVDRIALLLDALSQVAVAAGDLLQAVAHVRQRAVHLGAPADPGHLVTEQREGVHVAIHLVGVVVQLHYGLLVHGGSSCRSGVLGGDRRRTARGRRRRVRLLLGRLLAVRLRRGLLGRSLLAADVGDRGQRASRVIGRCLLALTKLLGFLAGLLDHLLGVVVAAGVLVPRLPFRAVGQRIDQTARPGELLGPALALGDLVSLLFAPLLVALRGLLGKPGPPPAMFIVLLVLGLL